MLFVVILGGKHPRAKIEVRDVVFFLSLIHWSKPTRSFVMAGSAVLRALISTPGWQSMALTTGVSNSAQ